MLRCFWENSFLASLGFRAAGWIAQWIRYLAADLEVRSVRFLSCASWEYSQSVEPWASCTFPQKKGMGNPIWVLSIWETLERVAISQNWVDSTHLLLLSCRMRRSCVRIFYFTSTNPVPFLAFLLSAMKKTAATQVSCISLLQARKENRLLVHLLEKYQVLRSGEESRNPPTYSFF